MVGAIVGVDMRVERLGEEEGVEGCEPMVVERSSGEVVVLDTMLATDKSPEWTKVQNFSCSSSQ